LNNTAAASVAAATATGAFAGSTLVANRTSPANTIGVGSGITQLSAGDFHVLALKSNGTVLAWGGNAYGQLGNGSTAQATGPVQVTGLTNATQVAAGAEFSLTIHTVPYLLGS
jgi:alpha-tubulin suppressor-like RCC1 family protein